MNNFNTVGPLGSWLRFALTWLKKSLNVPLIRLIMRVSFINIILLICGIKVLSATSAYEQDLDKVSVKIELNDERLPKAFSQIEEQTKYTFVFSGHTIANTIITLRGTFILKDALDQLLANTGFTYQLRKFNQIVISKFRDDEKKEHDDQSYVPPPTRAPSLNIMGRVVDATTQTGLPGVSVLVKGTTHGTVTDADGDYVLEAETTDILVFSSIGFKTQETYIAGKSTIDIVMEADATTMQEVVVRAGYWNVKQKENTGSMATVTAGEIASQPVANPLLALQGRATGVFVTQLSGVPGSGVKLRIRGVNSLRPGGNEPLYVVDGVPYTNTSIANGPGLIVGETSPFNNIDPSSIESIDFLKDADATAIYGSQGANGVVLITTKKGKAGKTNVTANFSSGIAKVPHMIDLLNTAQFIEMRKEAYTNDGVASYPSNAYDINGTWDQTRYTDWQKVLIGGTARMTNADASISGGSSNTRFLLGGSYIKQTTVYPGDFAYQRGAGHFNLNHDSENRKFQLTLTANFSEDNNNLPYNDLVTKTFELPPNAPKLYMDNGALNWENSTWRNPLAQLMSTYSAKTRGLFINSILSYEILTGLRIKTNIGYNILQMNEVSSFPLKALSPSDAASGVFQAGSQFGRSGTDTWIVEPQLEWVKKVWIGDLTVFTAATFRQSNQNMEFLQATGYTIDALVGDIVSSSRIVPISASNSMYRYNALCGRINYAINQKYFLNITGRRDGSSRFGPNRQFGNFAALGAAWIFSNEPLFSNNIRFISFGKLRGSFGTTGSDQIGDYQYLETYKAVLSYTGTSIIPTKIANPNFAWEVNRKLESAMELGFFDDRIKLGISWYRNQSSNQLVGQSIPGTTGFTSYQSNLPATVRNEGWEIDLSTTNITRNAFKWTSSFNLTIPTNKLVSYPDIENSSYAYVYEVGQSVFKRKRFHYLGVDPATGVYQFEDKDNNGNQFDNADRQALVTLGQDYYGGFRNAITWRGFDLSFFIQFVKQKGNNYMAGTPFQAPGGGSLGSAVGFNQPAFVMQRWTETNRNTTIEKFTTSISTNAGSAIGNSSADPGSDLTISDASFIRLQNVSLEWRFPQSVLTKSRLAGASVYVQGQNLFTLTNYYGFDPQTLSFTSLPALRVVTMGARLSL